MSHSSQQFDQEVHAIYQERNINRVVPIKNSSLWLDSWRGRAIFIILSALVAIAGSIWVVISLLPEVTAPLSDRFTSSVVVPRSELSAEAYQKMRGSVAVFGTTGDVTEGSQTKFWNQIYGYGLVISSDGWLVTVKSVGLKISTQSRIGVGDKIYHPVILVHDPALPLSYIKVVAEGLTSVGFADMHRVQAGDAVVLAQVAGPALPLVYSRTIAQVSAGSTTTGQLPTFTSEQIPDRYVLDASLPKSVLGLPVYNLRGEAVALVSDIAQTVSPQAVPLSFLSNILENLFKNKEVRRAKLGLVYRQDNWLWSEGGVNQGVQVLKLPLTNLSNTDWREGDQIVSVGGEPVGTFSLSAMLQQYRPGATVGLVMKRVNQDIKTEVNLSEIVSRAVFDITAQK